MYNDGFVVAVILGVIALLLPALWVAWWLIADLGERVNGAYPATRYENAEPRLPRAA